MRRRRLASLRSPRAHVGEDEKGDDVGVEEAAVAGREDAQRGVDAHLVERELVNDDLLGVLEVGLGYDERPLVDVRRLIVRERGEGVLLELVRVLALPATGSSSQQSAAVAAEPVPA